ncbi:glycoside hydrolase family 88 protein [Paenibacillus filicis]|uniref:Glycoside hydrolase family 88 protein n=1 Tax=Paenibacillus filicis TaxID=669464 RepID=A0ABU9DEW9_9BACL
MDPALRGRIDRMVRRITDRPSDGKGALCPMHWNGPTGVRLYGIYRAWASMREPSYVRGLTTWVDEHLPESYVSRSIQGTAPMLTVAELYGDTEIERYGAACRRTADWLLHIAARTPEGTLKYTTGPNSPRFARQVRGDTLWMSCLFLAKWAALSGNRAYADEAAFQLCVHLKLLRDQGTALYRHSWSSERPDRRSGMLWGRANSWMLMGAVELMEVLGSRWTGRSEVLASLVGLADTLAAVQREDGLFGIRLDHSLAPADVSATAGMAYGLRRGVRSGLLPARLLASAKRAEEAVIALINESGDRLLPVLDAGLKGQQVPSSQLSPLGWSGCGEGLTLLMLCERQAHVGLKDRQSGQCMERGGI